LGCFEAIAGQNAHKAGSVRVALALISNPKVLIDCPITVIIHVIAKLPLTEKHCVRLVITIATHKRLMHTIGGAKATAVLSITRGIAVVIGVIPDTTKRIFLVRLTITIVIKTVAADFIGLDTTIGGTGGRFFTKYRAGTAKTIAAIATV
tara:strand:- start:10 stop:459 length:450 start_codon:yes stop_codon:yes gene_type:complete